MTHDTPLPVPLAPVDALTAPFSLSVLTVTKGNASKQLLVGAQGQPIKGQGSLAITAGVLEHVQVAGLTGLQTLLRAIRPDQALVHGIVKGSQPTDTAPLVTKDARDQAKPGTLAPGTIARSKDFLEYPADRFLLMFDRDDNPEDPAQVTTAEALLALLAPLLPGLADAGVLTTVSTSSGIRDKQTNDWLIPPTGSHSYFLARGDLARFVGLLKIRLWNAGYGFCKLGTPNAQTGVAAVLERAAVDLMVFSPERLDYVAGARIAKNAPFYQDRGEPRLLPGGLLDLDAFPDVTPAERQAYEARLTAAKAALAPARFQQVQAVILAAEPELPADQVKVLAQQRLQHQEEGLLSDDFLLYFFHRKKAVAVKDLSADYDDMRLADPAEPTYRDGTDAIFHWRQGDWLINSFAHGLLTTYRAVPTPPPDPDEEDMADLLQRADAPKSRAAPAPPPDSILATAFADKWRTTLAFDLHRQAFMRYGATTGIFQELDDLEVDADLTTQLTRLLPDGFYTKTLRNVKYLLKSALHTRMASGPSTLVPFTNGVLDVYDMTWKDHSPDFRLTWHLPYAYEPTATCPRTQDWLLEACRGRADQVEVLRAFLKAVLCGRTDIQRFPELVGPGGSGKGTFTRLAQGLVGLDNVAVTELKYLESNRFETSNLIHKRLIVVADAEQWAGQITTLKALTGGDSLRVERKHVQTHPDAVAEGLVLVSANEPITSADYTSGLTRRRIPIPFQHQPAAWRNLLEIKGGVFQGELAGEFPGVVNWVLAMDDSDMLRYLLETSSVAPTLAASQARALVRTNPLAAWANDRLTLDPAPGEPGTPDQPSEGVRVGIARREEQGNRYEREDDWLFPNYVAYCDGTKSHALSLRRFTDLLLDLLTVQLRLATVEHKTTNKGSTFFGIRFRWPSDNEHTPTRPGPAKQPYRPKVPFLITGFPEAPTPPSPPRGGNPSPSEGFKAVGEGYGEGLESLSAGSEESEGYSVRIGREKEEREEEGGYAPPTPDNVAPRARAYRGRVDDPSLPSLPALVQRNPSLDPSPTPHSTPHRDAQTGGRLSPSYCPGCGRNSTWIIRTGQEVCCKCETPRSTGDARPGGENTTGPLPRRYCE